MMTMCIWTESFAEPNLDELLDEPIVAALMTSDGVDRDWLKDLVLEKGRDIAQDFYL